MIEIRIRIKPQTYYVISGEQSPEEKVEFNKGIFYPYYINPSVIKGFLRTAAVYAYYDSSCEILTSKAILSNLEKIKKEIGEENIKLSLTCSDIDELLKNKNSKEAKVYLNVLSGVINSLSRPCKICRVFGNSEIRGKLRIVYHVHSVNTYTIKGLKFSWHYAKRKNGIDVVGSKETIEFTILCEDMECKEVVENAVKMINRGVVRLGRFKSRGFGLVRAEIVSLTA
ncbi:MAG: RAMP superfamily CRISPR-associated protein [Sulfolobaceae archaeon]|nr:RAMP superfamily CRISPR-associated protein [Sulfolobaceae archaeon]